MQADEARRFRAALDVRRLRVLREVARHGSISGAADALNYTPSAVSQQLQVLEAEAGVALLERTPRSVTLTPAGEVLVAHTDVIVARLEDAEAQVRNTHGLQGGRLRLATFRSAAETLLAEAVVYFRRRYPRVELTLREGEPEEFLAGIRMNEFDLALDFAYDFMEPIRIDGVERTLLLHDAMMVALAGRPSAGGGAGARAGRPRGRAVDRVDPAQLHPSVHRTRVLGGGLRPARRVRDR